MRSAVAITIWGLLVGLCGCGVQAGPMLRGPSRSTYHTTLDLKMRFHSARHSGPYASVGAAWANPQGAPAFQMRHVSFGSGLRLNLCSSLRWELGGMLAFGQPSRVVYQDTGVFVGIDSAFLVRAPWWGNQDNLTGAAPFGYGVDLVVMGEGGYWSHRVGGPDRSRPEFGFGLGVRFTGFSDLLVAADDSWEEAP